VNRTDNTLLRVRILATDAGARLLVPRLERLRELAPDAEVWRVADDHRIVDPGGHLHADDPAAADPEFAWLTADTFARAGATDAWARILAHSPRLRWLQTPASGYLTFYDPLLERGVRVSGARVNNVPIAEYVLRAVLDHFQRPGEWAEAQRQHAWRPHQFREVFGTTWLVVGMGAIGTAVATRAQAFGARVVGVRRSPSGDEPAGVEVVTPDRLLEAVGRADVVVLALPSTPASLGIVDRAFLGAMRPASVFVNIARGSLVDDTALLEALDAGRPEVAILDAFATEPLPPDHPFWSHPRVVATPHTSAGGLARHGRGADTFLDNLGHYLRGEPLDHEVFAHHADPTGTVIDLVPREPPPPA
jgi:phosphoglycerate dehydrogenase-like enzyme